MSFIPYKKRPKKASKEGLELIAEFEGWVDHPYNDPTNNATIGYGHLLHMGPVTPADRIKWGKITKEQGLKLLANDSGLAAAAVAKYAHPTWQTRFDAMTSFAFNVGVEAFYRSTLLKKHLAGDYKGAADEFLKWNKSGGQTLPGLTRRRKAERELYLKKPAPKPKPKILPKYVVVQNCPVPRQLAPFLKQLLKETNSTLNSCYRGEEAKALLHKLGKHTQKELYDGYKAGLPGYYPANPPGYSTHELRNDGTAYSQWPRGAKIPWWACGIDVNDSDVLKMVAAAKRHGWQVSQTYPGSSSEYHHLNFRKPPLSARLTAFAKSIVTKEA